MLESGTQRKEPRMGNRVKNVSNIILQNLQRYTERAGPLLATLCASLENERGLIEEFVIARAASDNPLATLDKEICPETSAALIALHKETVDESDIEKTVRRWVRDSQWGRYMKSVRVYARSGLIYLAWRP